MAENFEWIHKQYDDREKYDNQYVAIKDRRIVDKDIDHDRLVKRMNITNYDESVAIEYLQSMTNSKFMKFECRDLLTLFLLKRTYG